MINGVSAQAYENTALVDFNNGFLAKARVHLLNGARASFGAGRANRMKDWAFYIETYSDFLQGKKFGSFHQMQEWIESNDDIPNRAL